MAVIKTIEKGESLTFGFVLPETYNLANLQSVKVYIGSTVYAHTMDTRTIRVELESNETALLTGRNIVHFVIDDAVFGIKKVNCGMLEVLPTQATHKDTSINTGYDVEIVLTIDVETVTIESVLYNILKGDKGDAGTIEIGTVETGDAGTDVIIENVGTPSEAVLNFTIPKGDAGYTPYIGENGNWFINGVDTGVQAEGDATQQWVTDNFVEKETGKSLVDDTEISKLNDYPTLTGVATDGFVNAAGELEQIAAAVGGFANNLYFSPTNSNVAGYKTLTYDLPSSETVVSQAVLQSDGDLLVASHLFSDAVAADIFPAGLWSFQFYGRVSSVAGAGSTNIGVRYFRYTSLGAKVYLFPTIVWSNAITNTVNNWIPIPVQQPSFVVEAGDRMGCDIYIKTSAATSRTVYYILGDGYASYLNNPNAVRHRILRAKNEELAYQHLDATTEKVTPIDADSVGLWNSVTGKFIRTTLTNFKAFFKTYFDTLYHAKLDYTPENAANKKTILTDSDIDYPTTKAVKTVTDDLKEGVMVNSKSIATLESILSDVNINQEAQVTASGVNTIALPKTAANTGMQVQLFGESNETSNVLGTGRVRSVGNNLIKPTYIIGFQVSTADGTFVNNATFSRSDYFRVAASTAYILSSNTNTGTDHRIAFYDLNKVFISGASQTSGQPISVTSPANAYYAIVSSLTTKVDTFRLTRGTSSFETYRQSILQLTAPELRSNGLIKDEIRKGANGYELVKRVGVGDPKSVLNLFTFIGVGWSISGNVLTAVNAAYSTSSSGYTIKNNYLYKVKFEISNYSQGSVSQFFSADGNSYSQDYNANGIYERYYKPSSTTGTLQFRPKDNFTGTLTILEIIDYSSTDGIMSGTSYMFQGSNVHYTLKTPTITPIPHAGLLNSNSNGTAYFEPIIADAGVYSSNLTIQLTDYPIASFESIRKYANGTYTELNPATAVIASGGLSFTHPDLASGDLVMFTYAYSKESIGRSMTLTHYDSRFVEADTANGKVYRWGVVITNGVPTLTVTEV